MKLPSRQIPSEKLLRSADEPEEERVDFEIIMSRVFIYINLVYYLPVELCVVDEEREVARLGFGPKNAIFEKNC